MNIIADYHVHSRFSDGQASLQQNAAAALAKGLKAVAMTEHGPRHLHAGIKDKQIADFLEQTAALAQQYRGLLYIKAGIEANPLHRDGTIDIPENFKSSFDVVCLGVHRSVWAKEWKSNVDFHIKRHMLPRKNRSRAMTDMLIAAMERNRVSFLAHPGQYTGPLDWKRLATACSRNNVAIEINARSGHLCFDANDARLMRDCGAVFVVNSDAHKTDEIGAFDPIATFLHNASLTHHDIVNAQGYDGKRPFGLNEPEGLSCIASL